MNNFWQNLPQPFFVLAPMEDVTDVVFRHVVARAAPPDVYFTEFTNSDSFCSPKGNHSTKGRLEFTDDEQPLVAHIWGDNPENFATMAAAMQKLGFAGIDINMGCPATNVAPRGKGAGLIRRPEAAAELIAAAKTGGLPVSVKTRLGYSSLLEMKPWLTHLLEQDVANLTIHLRTRKEMSKVPAHFELINEIVNLRDSVAPATLLTINGDIMNRQHGLELTRAHPGVNGVMIGRGVFQNPFAFSTSQPVGDQQKMFDLLRHHLDLFDQYQSVTGRPFQTLKRFFKIYLHSFDGAKELRERLMKTTSTSEVREIISSIDHL